MNEKKIIYKLYRSKHKFSQILTLTINNTWQNLSKDLLIYDQIYEIKSKILKHTCRESIE